MINVTSLLCIISEARRRYIKKNDKKFEKKEQEWKGWTNAATMDTIGSYLQLG